jgi:hypothetical protein
MAFMRIVDPRVVTNVGLYDEVASEVQIATEHPEGLIMHAAGEFDDKWLVVEVWESEAYALQFDAERLQPAIKALTGTRAPAPRSSNSELHLLVTP